MSAASCEQGPQPPGSATKSAINGVYFEWRDSLTAREPNEEVASALLSAQSLEYFGRIEQIAIRGTEDDLKACSLFDLSLVFILRMAAEDDPQLAALSTQDTAAFFLRRKLVAGDMVAGEELRDITVSGGSRGQASRYFRNGKPIGDRKLYFRKEQDRWRIDLMPVIQSKEGEILRAATEMGMDPIAYVYQGVELQTMKKLEVRYFRPIEAPR